jgi:hypothetical protein
MKFHMWIRKNAGHTKYLGEIESETMEGAFDKMKETFAGLYADTKNYREFYVDDSKFMSNRYIGRKIK